jgi:hypothetical protein
VSRVQHALQGTHGIRARPNSNGAVVHAQARKDMQPARQRGTVRGTDKSMKLEFAMLADSATTTADNKVDIKGAGVDIVQAPSYPAVHPTITLVGSFVLEGDDDTHPHELRVEGTTPSGEPWIGPVVQRFTPGMPQPNAERKKFILLLTFTGLVFPVNGQYLVRLFADGAVVSELPVNALVQAPMTPESISESQHSEV